MIIQIKNEIMINVDATVKNDWGFCKKKLFVES